MLVLCCEHMDACEEAGSDAHVRRIARFLGLQDGLSADAVATVARTSGHDWARENATRLSEAWMYERQLSVGRYEAPPLAPVSRIRAEKKTFPYATSASGSGARRSSARSSPQAYPGW